MGVLARQLSPRQGTSPPPQSPAGPRSYRNDHTPVHKQPSWPAHLHAPRVEPTLSHPASTPTFAPHTWIVVLSALPFDPSLWPLPEGFLTSSSSLSICRAHPWTPNPGTCLNITLILELRGLARSLVPLDCGQVRGYFVIVLCPLQC